jgi:hypothetical protein
MSFVSITLCLIRNLKLKLKPHGLNLFWNSFLSILLCLMGEDFKEI